MPRNRRDQPEAEKRAVLVAVARELFLRDGYAATSVGRIAKAAEVAPNTIYWYFSDKDALLIAVLDELLVETLARYAPIAEAPLAAQLTWLVGELRQIRYLVATVHARIGASPALDAWHTAFHETVEQLFASQIPIAPPPGVLEAEAKITTFAVEGLLTHDLDAATTAAICEALAARWTPPTAQPRA